MIDPDDVLGQIREYMSSYDDLDESQVGKALTLSERVMARVQQLDTYLSSGGRLPSAWGQAHRPTTRVEHPGGRDLAVPDDEPEPLGGPVPGVNGHVMPGEDDQ